MFLTDKIRIKPMKSKKETNLVSQIGVLYKKECGRRDLNPHSEIRTRT